MRSGVLVGTYPIKIVLVAGLFGFILITTSFKSIKAKLSKKDMYCDIEIKINNKYSYVKGVIDTGNFLKEPITKVPVVVVERKAIENIVPEHILNNLEEIINGKDVDLKEFANRIRIIPFASLGKENGILLGIKIDSIVVKQDEKTIKNNNVIIGIYNGRLTKNGKYKALIGLELLEEYKGGKTNEHIRDIKV